MRPGAPQPVDPSHWSAHAATPPPSSNTGPGVPEAMALARAEATVVTAEPLIHSGITDVLDDTHPLAHETVYCDGAACRGRAEMLHHCINENMQTWVEAHNGNYCLPCFTALDEAESVDGWSGA